MNEENNEWLYNLNFLYNNIENSLLSYIKLHEFYNIDEETQSDLDAVFISYIFIYTNSLLDEWKLYGKENKELKKICSPALKAIDKRWPDIKMLRNQVLTHNHRDKENKSIHISGNWLKYKVPMGIVEIELLSYLLGLMVEAANKLNNYDFNALIHPANNTEMERIWMSKDESDQAKETIKEKINFNIKEYLNHHS